MKVIGGGASDDRRCPQCRQFIANAELIVSKMETIENKISEIKSDLSKYEWIVIENSVGIKNMDKNGMELDKESFEVAFAQSKKFLRLLETIDSSLNSIRRHYNDMDYSDGRTMGVV